jgi:hypothetical protein
VGDVEARGAHVAVEQGKGEDEQEDEVADDSASEGEGGGCLGVLKVFFVWVGVRSCRTVGRMPSVKRKVRENRFLSVAPKMRECERRRTVSTIQSWTASSSRTISHKRV